MRSLLLPTFSSAFFRGSQSNTCVTLGLEQGVQPGGAGAFFEGHMQAAVQTVDKGEDDLRSSRGWLPSLPYRWNPTRPRRSLLGVTSSPMYFATFLRVLLLPLHEPNDQNLL